MKGEGKKRVAVLGAGITGIVSCKLLLEHPERFEITCWESTDKYGGEWNYTEDTTITETSRPNAVYTYLKTNSNAIYNSLPGLEIPQTRQWHTHLDILDYLHQYVKKFNIKKHIKFETRVETVSCVAQDDGSEIWRIVTIGKDGSTNVSHHDAVIVGTGQYGQPNLPHYPGEDHFEGEIIHSCQFRRPQVYTDKTVLTIGGKPSATDITDQISKYAKKVYHNSDLFSQDLMNNMEQTKAKYIKSFTKDSVIMEDGQELKVEAVVFCTGYHVTFPCLDESCDIDVIGDLPYPLYKMIVNSKHPTMFFNNLWRAAPYIHLSGLVAQATVNILLGISDLPSPEVMKKEVDGEIAKYKTAGRPLKSIANITYLDRSLKIVEDVALLARRPYSELKMEIFSTTMPQLVKGRLVNMFRGMKFTILENREVEIVDLPEEEAHFLAGFKNV